LGKTARITANTAYLNLSSECLVDARQINQHTKVISRQRCFSKLASVLSTQPHNAILHSLMKVKQNIYAGVCSHISGNTSLAKQDISIKHRCLSRDVVFI